MTANTQPAGATTDDVAAAPEQPFVGREAVLAALDAALGEACKGNGQVRLVGGEAGSGKTTLLAEFARRAQAAQARLVVVGGTCNAQIGDGDPYAPFRQVVALIAAGEGVTRYPTHLLTAEGWRRLAVIRKHSLQLLLDFSPDLVALFVPGAVALAAKFGVQLIKQSGVLNKESLAAGAKIFEDNRKNNPIITQYAAFLRKFAAQQPVLLVVDDLQWVDRASVEMFFQLGRDLRGCQVLLVGLYRPNDLTARHDEERHPFMQVINELERYHGEILIDLDRTGAEEGQLFVDALLDAEPNRLDAAFRAALHKRTEGQPLFTVELLRAMQEAGSLQKDKDGYWIANAAIDWERLPARVEGVINARVEQIADDLKSILLVASVEGQDFTAQVVARVEEINERRLLRRLSQELECQHHLVREHGEVEVGNQTLTRFRFAHALFQQYFYHETRAERRSLHAAVGELLEELYGDQTDDIVLQLARHFKEAGAWPKALDYHLRAGEQALHGYACADAVSQFRHALECAAHMKAPPQAHQLWRVQQGLGEALTITGQLETAREHLALAQDLAQAAGDADTAGRSCRWLAHSFEVDGEFDAALAWVDRGLAVLRERVVTETVQLRLIAGLIHVRRGEFVLAGEQAEEVLAAAQALNDPYALARAYLLKAVVELQRGHSQQSAQLAQQGLDLYARVNDIAGEATATNQLANALFNLGQWTAADAAYRRAQADFVKIGDRYNRAFVENNLGEIALHQGRLDDALCFYQAALRDLEASGGSPYVLGVLHNNLSTVRIRRGELEEARAELNASQERLTAARSREILPELHRHQAEIAWLEGDLATATTEASLSLTLAQELQAENEAGIAQRMLGELALAQGELATAAAQLAASLATLDVLGETFQAACTRLARARLALAQDDPAAARVELDQCGPVFRDLGAAPELAAVETLWKVVAQRS